MPGRGHGRLTEVCYLDGRSRPEQLMQLHELEDLEDVFELEKPFRLECEQDLDSVVGDDVGALCDCGVDYLEDFLLALHSDLRYKALIVLEDLDVQLVRSTTTFCFDFAYAELHASETIGSNGMFDLRGTTQVRSHGTGRFIGLRILSRSP